MDTRIANISHSNLFKALLAVFVSAYVLSSLSGCSHTSSSEKKQVEQESKQYQKLGIMSESEHERVLSIVGRVTPNGKLSKEEVDWLLALSQRPGTEQQKGPRMQWVILALGSGNHDTIPVSKRGAVFDFATQAVRYTGHNASAVRHTCYIFEELRDKRALPYLTPLLSSDDPDVVRAARQAIHALNKR